MWTSVCRWTLVIFTGDSGDRRQWSRDEINQQKSSNRNREPLTQDRPSSSPTDNSPYACNRSFSLCTQQLAIEQSKEFNELTFPQSDKCSVKIVKTEQIIPIWTNSSGIMHRRICWWTENFKAFEDLFPNVLYLRPNGSKKSSLKWSPRLYKTLGLIRPSYYAWTIPITTIAPDS